jgi:antitoxin (DNA-binding transcriptional repressor) of toxin-antitoxin stability system
MSNILEYQAADAKARFAESLDQVENGRTILITRHGKPIARLETEVRRAEVAKALDELRAIVREFGKAPLDDVLATILEGYKY